jgi:hypothetical protein
MAGAQIPGRDSRDSRDVTPLPASREDRYRNPPAAPMNRSTTSMKSRKPIGLAT